MSQPGPKEHHHSHAMSMQSSMRTLTNIPQILHGTGSQSVHPNVSGTHGSPASHPQADYANPRGLKHSKKPVFTNVLQQQTH